MAFNVGDTIGDYEIIGLLGAGGMGRVYKVRNTISDRVEALKILLPDLSDQPELADRFVREIKLQASLVHPNIAALHTALRVNNQLLMLMELIEGVTLEHRLTQGPIDLWKGKEYMVQVLAALSYAHSRGVIHRDLKPANMMITPADTIKLMDFGIAKGASDHRLTQTGMALGSLFYMSPEQVKGGQPDARSDLYSLGITLYEIVTGERPYKGESDYAIMTAHLLEDPRPPVELNQAVPEALSDTILHAIRKEPSERFQSADEFRAALEQIRTGTGGAPTVRVAARTSSILAQKKASGKGKAIGGVIAIAALLAVLMLSRAFDARKTAPPESVPAPRAEVVVSSAPAASAPTPERVTVAPRGESVKPALQQPLRQADTAAVTQTLAQAPTVPTTPTSPPQVSPPPAQPKPAVTPPPAQPDPRALAEAEWSRIASSQDAAALREFRRRYPDTPFAQQALARIEQIERDAAQAAAETKRIEREAAAKSVLDVIERYRAANERLDAEAIRAVWPGRGEAVLNRIAESFRNTRSMRLSLQPTGEPQISGDTAVVTLRRRLSVELKNGPRPRPVEGHVTVRLQRSASGWVIVSLE